MVDISLASSDERRGFCMVWRGGNFKAVADCWGEGIRSGKWKSWSPTARPISVHTTRPLRGENRSKCAASTTPPLCFGSPFPNLFAAIHRASFPEGALIIMWETWFRRLSLTICTASQPASSGLSGSINQALFAFSSRGKAYFSLYSL